MFRLKRFEMVAVLVFVLTGANVARAQNGIIAGSVKDSTGAMLPGVTVEASSPALIEKIRSVVTDTAGAYKIVDLRAGEYAVTFSLTGFNLMKREGIQLTSGVTASVDAELRIGSLQETVTVSGQAPLVDVQNTTQHTALTRQVLDDLPTGRQVGNYGVLIPGVVTNMQDVGGISTSSSTSNANIMGVHGSNANEMPVIIDGLRYGNIFGTGAGISGPYLINNAMVEEVAVDTSGAGADADVGGFRSNVILKQGGNRFTSFWYAGGSGATLQSNNIDDALRNRGALTPTRLTRQWDVNVAAGGPVAKDRIWFYGSYRNSGNNQEPTGAYSALDPSAIVFRPPTIVNGVVVSANSADVAHPAVNQIHDQYFNGRLTIQTSRNSKLSVYGDYLPRNISANGLGATTTFEATTRYDNPLNMIQQATWNWTITNKLLLEAGETLKPDSWQFVAQPSVNPNVSPVQDTGTGIMSGNSVNRNSQTSLQHNGKAVLTYVTGSSSLKTGGQWFSGSRTGYVTTSNDAVYVLRNGVPQAITQQTTPLVSKETLKLNLGLFVQEQYTLHRMTLNAGLRFDYLNEFIPAQHLDAVRYAPALDYPEIDNVPNWKDLSPRVGMSYDVFGDGKTAIKWNVGRFVEAQATGFPQAVNPTRAAGTTSGQRAWADANGNLTPDCDLTNLSANGECGAILNPNFGKPATAALRYDPAAVNGWGKRGYNWELMAGGQHQVADGLSVDASYNRRWFGNFRIFQATQVTAANYDPFCVTSPTDARLPGGGGQEICGFYNIQPQFAGQDQTNILVTNASTIGNIDQKYDGVDLSAKLRLPKGILVQGGTSTGRTYTNWCGVVQGHPEVIGAAPYVSVTGSPSTALAQFAKTTPYCESAAPFQTQVKLSGVYPLPWNFVTSATFQSIAYPQEFYGTFGGILATRAFTNAEIAPSLHRNLAGGAQSAVLQMLPASSMFGDRLNQIDWRITRRFSWGSGKIQPQLDIYNLTNNNAVVALNNTYGASWQQPIQILAGRVVKFGFQATF